MNLGEKVKKRRLELNLTQEELAKKMGYSSRVSINKIELGRPVS
jgi:transcriptional regulator with XRE-family HTH domain|nr:MAG TPA: helix-turn-helix domain protein [Caudoviricetes sp.]